MKSNVSRLAAITVFVVWTLLCFLPRGSPGFYTDIGFPFRFLHLGDTVVILNGEHLGRGFSAGFLILDIFLAFLAAALTHFAILRLQAHRRLSTRTEVK